jgi:predicted metal-binding membrane protein
MDLGFLIDGDSVPGLIRILHFALAGSSLACVLAYVGPALRSVRSHPREARFMMWTVMIAAMQIPSVWPRVFIYVTHNVQPVFDPTLPWGWRIVSLLGFHLAFMGRWAEAVPSRFAQRFAFGVVLTFLTAVGVSTLLPTSPE